MAPTASVMRALIVTLSTTQCGGSRCFGRLPLSTRYQKHANLSTKGRKISEKYGAPGGI